MTNLAEGIIYGLLGSGGAAFIWTTTRSYLAIRSRVDLREDKALEWIARDQKEARNDLIRERKWGSYWYRRAAVFERELIRNNIPVPPNGDEPPYRNAQHKNLNPEGTET